jgi:hypothetical protein
MYHCLNYTAPLHCDDDAVASFCTQLELAAYKPWKEYYFIHMQYGLYLETQGNMLWYVDLC